METSKWWSKTASSSLSSRLQPRCLEYTGKPTREGQRASAAIDDEGHCIYIYAYIHIMYIHIYRHPHTHTYIHICTCIYTYLYAYMIMYTKGIYIRIRENTNIHISYTCMKSHFVNIFVKRAPHTSAPLLVTRRVLIDHRQLHCLAVGLIKTHRFVVRECFRGSR